MNILESTAPVENPAILRLTKREIDREAFKKDVRVGDKVKRGYRNATHEDVSRVLRGNWIVVDDETDRPVIAYLVIPDDFSGMMPYLHRIKWTVSNRNDGTPSQAKTVGHLERNPVRQRDFCRMAGLATEDPEGHARILEYIGSTAAYYERLNPQLFAGHTEAAGKVLDQYRIGESPFTSAIINKDNVLPYHYDSGNFKDVWSLMLGFKKDVEDGYLVVPEYDLALEVADNSLSGFDGQVALHGVSPFKKLSRYAYRYTIVAYSKSGMWKCLSLDEEIARARKQRTQKEIGRWQRQLPVS
jgi:hypothetical protein